MNEQLWWLWVAKIVGTLAFVVIIIDFFVNKRKIPFYVIVMSFITCLAGITYCCFIHQKVLNIIIVGLFSFIVPLLLWFLCGGPVFSQGHRHKNNNAEEESNRR